MAPPAPYMNSMRSWLAMIPLFALLVLAFYIAGSAWVRFDADIPLIGWLAIAGGAAMALLVGGGLMALLFYSSRHGYDDLSRGDGANDPANHEGRPEASWKRTDSA